jgi:hypothetical protein
VPQGFKRAIDAMRFDATRVSGTGTTTVGGFTVTNTPRLPRNEPRTETTTAAAAPVVHQHIYQFGERSTVIEGVDLDPREIFDGFVSEARRRANAANGANAPLSAAWEPV